MTSESHNLILAKGKIKFNELIKLNVDINRDLDCINCPENNKNIVEILQHHTCNIK